jgi:hypothetical protein
MNCRFRWLLSMVVASAMLAISAVQAKSAETAERLNIVFMLIDDMGWGELGCYGNTFNETPRIDKFAASAMRFTAAYCQPTCSPTRASLMTGQYPHRTGIEDYLDVNSPQYLDPWKQYTINRLLTDAGYVTCHIGKWHLDTHFKDPKGSSKQFGFDEVIGTETKYIADGDYFFPFDKIRTLPERTPHEFLPDRLSDEAVGFSPSSCITPSMRSMPTSTRRRSWSKNTGVSMRRSMVPAPLASSTTSITSASPTISTWRRWPSAWTSGSAKSSTRSTGSASPTIPSCFSCPTTVAMAESPTTAVSAGQKAPSGKAGFAIRRLFAGPG